MSAGAQRLVAGFRTAELDLPLDGSSIAGEGTALAETFERVARHLFVPEERRMGAYLDETIPLGFGRVLARPGAYLTLLAAADLQPGQRILVSGEASGYLAALLAELGTDVMMVEANGTLAAAASASLEAAGYRDRVIVSSTVPQLESNATRDGGYDRILLAGSVLNSPRTAPGLLRTGGQLLWAARMKSGTELMKLTRREQSHLRQALGDIELPALFGFEQTRGAE